MSKLHQKTGSVCIICDEPITEDGVMIHKTRRQSHRLCKVCAIGYLRPILEMACKNLRKNIRVNVGMIKCPGAYHSEPRNQCKKTISLRDIKIPESEISSDIFRIIHTLSSDNVYLCPEGKCGQVIEVDPEYTSNKLICYDCKITWCRQCLTMPYHDNKSCIELEMENKNSDNGKFIWEMKSKGKLKFCPQCRSPCIKNNGCNKMICSQCNCKWCWICCSMNIDYDHYNSDQIGSCTGKLWQGVDENGNAIEDEINQLP